MPKSVNKVILIGNAGKDPETKFTPGGTAVCKISIATNERWKDKDGEWKDKVEWHSLVFWKRLAEVAGEYVKKGSRIYIEGRLQTSSWDDKQSGDKRYRTEIVVSDLCLLDGKDGKGGGSKRKDGGKAAQDEPSGEYSQEEITDDDIPF